MIKKKHWSLRCLERRHLCSWQHSKWPYNMALPVCPHSTLCWIAVPPPTKHRIQTAGES